MGIVLFFCFSLGSGLATFFIAAFAAVGRWLMPKILGVTNYSFLPSVFLPLFLLWFHYRGGDDIWENLMQASFILPLILSAAVFLAVAAFLDFKRVRLASAGLIGGLVLLLLLYFTYSAHLAFYLALGLALLTQLLFFTMEYSHQKKLN